MINCIYNKEGEMRVVDDAKRVEMVDGVAWFDDPKCTKPHLKTEEELQAEIKATEAKIKAMQEKHAQEAKESDQDELQDKKRGRKSKEPKSA